MRRLVLLVTSPRVPAGCLTFEAWQALHHGAVCTVAAGDEQLATLAAAGVAVDLLPDDAPPDELARLFAERATDDVPAVWVAGPDGDEAFGRALGALVLEGPELSVEVLHGSWDVPGARLLDAVTVMDRLRSPGGCPWDAKQTHLSLAPYLIEEAYETLETIEDGDLDALREEIGDVLLQVLFHARVASERGDDGWTIDDVAGGLVEKLVRRHPHVFGDVTVGGAEDVQRNWDALKAAEKGGRASVAEGVPLGQPALALAAKLQKRAASLGLPADLLAPLLGAAPSAAAAVAAGAAVVEERGGDDQAVGELLFAAVALARAAGVDAEGALRTAGRTFRDRLAAAEAALRASGVDPAAADEVTWREIWLRTGPADPDA